jgi:hypothetical protein
VSHCGVQQEAVYAVDTNGVMQVRDAALMTKQPLPCRDQSLTGVVVTTWLQSSIRVGQACLSVHLQACMYVSQCLGITQPGMNTAAG